MTECLVSHKCGMQFEMQRRQAHVTVRLLICTLYCVCFCEWKPFACMCRSRGTRPLIAPSVRLLTTYLRYDVMHKKKSPDFNFRFARGK